MKHRHDRLARASRHRGIGAIGVVAIVCVLAAVAAGGFFLQRDGGDDDATNGTDLFTARIGSFDITIPASGDLAAKRQIEISSQLETRAVITEIVDEGARVKEGDLLVALDDEDIRNRIKDVEVSAKAAEAAWESATSNLEIRQNASISQLELADVDIRLAELALEAWEKGTDVSMRQQLDLDVRTAELDNNRLVERFAASKDLFEQEFISEDEFKRDEIEMIRAERRFEDAKLARTVYLEYEREQQRARLAADLQKARDSRAETAKRNENELRMLASEVDSRSIALKRERERLEKVRKQLDKCRITAPQDGLVVYASSLGGRRFWQQEENITVGTELRRNKTVMVLPDTSEMVAEVKVNEALSGKIRPGQRAVIYSDALPNTALDGEVISVGVLAENGGWRDPNRRDYTVRIALVDGNEHGLKPSMRCRASIYVERVDDVMHVPIQAVFRDGPVAFVYEPDGSGYAQKQVQVGRSSEMFIEITDGLGENDTVLLRAPAPERITSRIDVDSAEQKRRSPKGPPANPAAAAGPPAATPKNAGQGRPARAGR